MAAAFAEAVVIVCVAVVVVAVVVGVCVAINNYVETKTSTKTKVLADVKVRQQTGKHYQLAYISTYGALCRIGAKMDFIEALAALGITGATNSIYARYTYDRSRSSYAQETLQHRGNGYWGIYADTQSAAKALAIVMGYTKKPEVHGTGMYGHYHDFTHTFHIWYGGQIVY